MNVLDRPLVEFAPVPLGCRCDGDWHEQRPSCYLPGRLPVDEAPVVLAPTELDERLAEARAEAEEALSDTHVIASDVVDALRKVKSSKLVRSALADVLGVRPEELEQGA